MVCLIDQFWLCFVLMTSIGPAKWVLILGPFFPFAVSPGVQVDLSKTCNIGRIRLLCARTGSGFAIGQVWCWTFPGSWVSRRRLWANLFFLGSFSKSESLSWSRGHSVWLGGPISFAELHGKLTRETLIAPLK